MVHGGRPRLYPQKVDLDSFGVPESDQKVRLRMSLTHVSARHPWFCYLISLESRHELGNLAGVVEST